MPPFDRSHLQADLLRQVSRSFYLSMKVLPRSMREPISLGYLLARTSDTIADTAGAPAPLRCDCLEEFRKMIQEGNLDFGSLYQKLMRDFSRHQSNASERELLQRLPDCLDWLQSLDPENRKAIEQVLNEITSGQLWDIERFETGESGTIRFAGTAPELETYTYQVAGCVGEFWTHIGYHNLGERFADLECREKLLIRGKELGQGLQLINILRDLGEDLRNGRCYLPKDELDQAGWKGDCWQDNETMILEVAAAWRKQCRARLAEGRRYLSGLRRGRVRYATALPMILAEKTVDLLEKESSGVLRRKIKIPRSAVRKAMIEALGT